MANEASAPAEAARASDSDVKLVAGYPGPALLLDGAGKTLLANAKGTGLEKALAGGAVADIETLVATALESASIANATLAIATSRGELVLDVTAVPILKADGTVDKTLLLARDLTMERNLRTTLVESRQRYKDLVEISSDFSWEVDAQGKLIFVSPQGALGYKPDELVGHEARGFVIDADEYTPFPFTTTRKLENVEMWMINKDGSTACVVVSALPLVKNDDDSETWIGCRGNCRDVTEERESEAALARARHREQLLNYIVSQIRDEIEPHDMLMAAATASARALGAAGSRIFREDVEREAFSVAAEYGNVEGVEELSQKIAGLKAGEVIAVDTANWAALLATTQYRGDVNGALAMWKPKKAGAWDDDHRLMLTDVANQLGIASEQIANHERIVKLSRTDGMTGLLNRRAFYDEELPRRIARLARSGQTASMFYVDMDNFKRVNDVHGHQAGDDAILFLRDMLINFSRPGDLVARLGGDEFGMWLDGIDEETSEKRAGQLIQTSKQMVSMSGDEDHPLGISIGVAFFDPASGESLDDLLARSDAAMYSVKKRSKGGFEMAPPPGTPLELPE
ncbi:diguanylate cyclase [Thalassospiraceae bacterium LMO-JJ14]|nr:diguanylate cyclase [Thalassospiraceae bacterium LMO-JJ14]